MRIKRLVAEIGRDLVRFEEAVYNIKSRAIQNAVILGFAPLLTLIFLCKVSFLLGTRHRKRLIVAAPASAILAVIRFLVPKRAFDRIFAQAIEDFREEYYHEVANGREWRARWLHVCLYLTLISTLFLWFGTSTAKKMFDLWKIT
ncbi:hypothetical protein [Mesorhizobium muleiense]|uniref:hypothetical protein n=1 Tax=Mesorhizobium muleiense TaxID=1004279 RepID=UPI001F47EE86|nr:hypothetical protein [Mesorhizobium muleiense]MCF6112017.1 hypothetical protein [Mesorhizobium muleiense]